MHLRACVPGTFQVSPYVNPLETSDRLTHSKISIFRRFLSWSYSNVLFGLKDCFFCKNKRRGQKTILKTFESFCICLSDNMKRQPIVWLVSAILRACHQNVNLVIWYFKSVLIAVFGFWNYLFKTTKSSTTYHRVTHIIEHWTKPCFVQPHRTSTQLSWVLHESWIRFSSTVLRPLTSHFGETENY